MLEPSQDYSQGLNQSITTQGGAPKQLSSRGIRFFNRVVEKYENKFYQKKTRPSSIKKRAEEVYDENIQLKHQINQLKDHLTTQKTQNQLLNNELDKQRDLMTSILGNCKGLSKKDVPPLVVVEETTVKQTELVLNLKRQLDIALKDLAQKENDIKTIQKHTKVTQYKELDEECKMYMNECFRLHRLLKKFLIQSGMSRGGFHSPSLTNLEVSVNDISQQQPSVNGLDGQAINKHITELQERVGFFKNQNASQKQELDAFKARFDIQANQIRQLKEQNYQLVQEVDKTRHNLQQQASSSHPSVVDQGSQLPQLKTVKDDKLLQSTQANYSKLESQYLKLKNDYEASLSQIEQLKLSQKSLGPSNDIELMKQKLANQKITYDGELKSVKDLNADLEQKLNGAQIMLAQAKSQQQSLQNQLNEAKTNIESENAAKIGELTQQNKELKQQQFENKLKLDSIQSQIEQKDYTIDDLKQKLSNLQRQMIEELDMKDVQLQEFKKNLITSKKDSQASLDTAQQALKDSIDSLNSKLKSKNDEIANLKASLTSVQSQLDTTHKILSDTNFELDKMKNEQEKAKQIQDSYNQNKNILDQQVSSLNDTISDLNLKLQLKDSEVKNLKEEMTKLKNKNEQKLLDIKTLQSQMETLSSKYETLKLQSASEDQELMKKLEELMVSLQLKDKDMKDQAKKISLLNQEIETKDSENEELKSQICLKEAEMTTIRTFFEKSENQCDVLNKEIQKQRQATEALSKEKDALKTECELHKKTYEKVQKEFYTIKQEYENLQLESLNIKKSSSKNVDNDANKEQLELLQKEIKSLNEILDQERKLHLADIQNRFRRCLEILQIYDVKGLTNFLKTASSEKNSEEDLEEYLAMKFNMTKVESAIFLKKVLCLTGKYQKEEMIERFISKIGKEVAVLDKDKVSKAYLELTIAILAQNKNVDEFLSKNKFDKTKIMHFYLVEKIISGALKTSKHIPTEQSQLILTIITHLLNQSRNFYQIESRVLKDNLMKQAQQAVVEADIRKKEKAKDSWGDSPVVEQKQKAPVKDAGEEEEEEEYDEEYAYEDEEEEKLMEDDKKERQAFFDKALKSLKNESGGRGEKETGLVLQLNTKLGLTSQGSFGAMPSPPSYAKALSQQMKAQKHGQNIYLQQIALFLVQGMMNLRQFLKVYHIGSADIPFCNKEIEVLSFDEFLFFIQQQNVFSKDSDFAKLGGRPLEAQQLDEVLETMLDSMQCMHFIKSVELRVIELQKLIEALEACGYKDLQRPKSKKNFDFNRIDLKSIRIMNRLSQHIYKQIQAFIHSSQITGQLSKEQSRILLNQIIENQFADIKKKVTVSTKTKEEKLFIIQKETFFKKLFQLKIKKSAAPHENLCDFLKIDQQFSEYILLKKLARAIEVFNANSLFNQIGTKRVMLTNSKPPAQLQTQSTKVKYQQDQVEQQQLQKQPTLKQEQPLKKQETVQQPSFSKQSSLQPPQMQKQATFTPYPQSSLQMFSVPQPPITSQPQKQPTVTNKQPEAAPVQEESEYEYGYEDEEVVESPVVQPPAQVKPPAQSINPTQGMPPPPPLQIIPELKQLPSTQGATQNQMGSPTKNPKDLDDEEYYEYYDEDEK